MRNGTYAGHILHISSTCPKHISTVDQPSFSPANQMYGWYSRYKAAPIFLKNWLTISWARHVWWHKKGHLLPFHPPSRSLRQLILGLTQWGAGLDPMAWHPTAVHHQLGDQQKFGAHVPHVLYDFHRCLHVNARTHTHTNTHRDVCMYILLWFIYIYNIKNVYIYIDLDLSKRY